MTVSALAAGGATSAVLPADASRRRLLVVSYHFPPAVAIGGRRWQRMSHFAAERGWGVDVIANDVLARHTANPGSLGVPADLRVFGVAGAEPWLDAFTREAKSLFLRLRPGARPEPGPEPGRRRPGTPGQPRSYPRSEVRWTADIASISRAWHAWRAVRSEWTWAGVAARVAAGVVDPGVHRAVVSCGPPHGVHEAGRRIAAAAGLPFVMDMRDPWSLQQRLVDGVASPLWYRMAERSERRAVARSALVVCNTGPAAEAMRAAHPGARVIAVMNGMDEVEVPVPPLTDRFVLGYAGSVYLDRDPAPLFRAAASVVEELGLSPERFGIEFIGHNSTYDGRSLEEIAAAEGVGAHFRLGHSRPHREAMEFLAGCAMLVSLPQDSTLAIPSKVFEYLQFPAWVLAMTDRPSATASVLEGTGADIVAPHDTEALTRAIRTRYLQFAGGERPEPLGRDPRLTRRHQAGVFLDALEEVTGRGSR
jgi:hypothetical protein